MAIVPLQGSFLDDNVLVPLNVANEEGNYLVGREMFAQGVFADTPLATPKYMRHREGRHHEFEGSMARMLIQIPEGGLEALVEEMSDFTMEQIARVVASDLTTSTGGLGYLDFLLESATHSFNEKVQLSENLADNYVAFFYGTSPPVFNYSGTLMNTYQDDWTMNMFRLFTYLGRGTMLARRGFVMHLRYDSMIVSGAMMNLTWQLNAGREGATQFSFQYLVKSINIALGATGYPTDLKMVATISPDDSVFLPYDVEAQALSTYSGAGKTYVGTPPGAPGPEGVPDYDTGGDVTDTGGGEGPTGGGIQQLPETTIEV